MTDICENPNLLNKNKLFLLNEFLNKHKSYLANDIIKINKSEVIQSYFFMELTIFNFKFYYISIGLNLINV